VRREDPEPRLGSTGLLDEAPGPVRGVVVDDEDVEVRSQGEELPQSSTMFPDSL
jgi:hypothetical protein